MPRETLIGAALPNDQGDVLDLSSEDWAKLRDLRPGVVGTLYTGRPDEGGTRHRRALYEALEREFGGRLTYVLRVGPSRKIDGRTYWRDYLEPALSSVPGEIIRSERLVVRHLNEVNLPAEGGWTADEYAAFLWAVRRARAGLVPIEVQWAAAPLSMGVPGWAEWLRRFDGLGGTGAVDRLSVNYYPDAGQDPEPFFALGLPVDVTEFGAIRPDRAPGYVAALRTLAAGGADTVQVFILGGDPGTPPAWDGRYILTADECRALGALGGRVSVDVPEPVPAPEPVPPPAPTEETPMPPIVTSGRTLEGRGMWVWYVSACGGAAGIVAKAKRAGLSWVAVKGGDGPSLWEQLTPELVAALHAAGLKVYAWHYAYLGYLPNTAHGSRPWTVSDEVGTVRAMFAQAPGVDGFIADVEAEAEGRADQAEQYARDIRARLPHAFFGYAPLPVIDYHQALPYVQFDRYCDGVLPQFYVRALSDGNPKPYPLTRLDEMWERWVAAWAAGGVPAPTIYPVFETYGTATYADVIAYEAYAATDAIAPDTRFAAWSYWSMDAAREEHYQAFADVDAARQTPAPSLGRLVDRGDVADRLNGAWDALSMIAAQADVLAVLEHADRRDKIHARVLDAQREIDGLKMILAGVAA